MVSCHVRVSNVAHLALGREIFGCKSSPPKLSWHQNPKSENHHPKTFMGGACGLFLGGEQTEQNH